MATNETLVFIHGSGDSAAVWGPLIALLPEVGSVALDLPGHGALVDAPGAPTMSVADYAAFVHGEIERRGLSQVTLMGHSLGGAIALQLALASPALVSRLGLIGSGARLRVAPAFLDAAREADPQGASVITRMSFAEEHTAEADAYHASRAPTAPGILYRDLAACNQFDVMGELGRITQPTLVAVGEGDRMTPPKFAEFLAAQVRGSTIVIIPDAGHYVQIEQPQRLADAIRAWLA